jgi:hypothetical protein
MDSDWRPRQDLNLRPWACEAPALSTELRGLPQQRRSFGLMVRPPNGVEVLRLDVVSTGPREQHLQVVRSEGRLPRAAFFASVATFYHASVAAYRAVVPGARGRPSHT